MGAYSSALRAMRTLIEGPGLQLRRTTWEGKDGDGVGAAEAAVTAGGVQRYAYDMPVLGQSSFEASSGQSFDWEPKVAVVVFVPIEASKDRQAQRDEITAYGKGIAQRLSQSLAFRARLLGLPGVQRREDRNLWILVLEIGLRFEVDLSAAA